jgi:RHS repeat-associated protein
MRLAFLLSLSMASSAFASTPGLMPGDHLLSPAPEIVKDEHNRITTITSASGETTKYEYFGDDDRALMKSVEFPDGRREEFTRTAAVFANAVLLPFTQGLALPDHALCASQNRIGFQGYFYSCTTKTYLTPSGRMYDPDTARFQQQDSYMGEITNPPSLHRYNYGYQNPTRYRDPSGHCPDGCDPLANLPPEVIEQANQAQRQAIDQTFQAGVAGLAATQAYVSDTVEDVRQIMRQGGAFVASETGALTKAIRGDDPGAIRIGAEWATGFGPRHRDFDGSNTMTHDIQRSPEGVQANQAMMEQLAAMEDIQGPIKVDAGRNLKLEPRTDFLVGFALDLAGRNQTRAYLGSRRGVGYVVGGTGNERTVEYTTSNDTSAESFLRFPPPWGYELDRPSLQKEVGAIGLATVTAPINFAHQMAIGSDIGQSYASTKQIFDGHISSVNPHGDFIPKTIFSNDPFGVRGPMSTVSQTFTWRETVRIETVTAGK